MFFPSPQLPATSYQLPATSYQPPVFRQHLEANKHEIGRERVFRKQKVEMVVTGQPAGSLIHYQSSLHLLP
jgi:hypothetical protein